MALSQARNLLRRNNLSGDLKGLAHADLAKKTIFCMHIYCFMCDYYVAFISALVLLKCGNLRITVLA